MSPRVATRHAGSVRHVGDFGIEEITGLFSQSPFLARTQVGADPRSRFRNSGFHQAYLPST